MIITASVCLGLGTGFIVYVSLRQSVLVRISPHRQSTSVNTRIDHAGVMTTVEPARIDNEGNPSNYRHVAQQVLAGISNRFKTAMGVARGVTMTTHRRNRDDGFGEALTN